MRNTLVPRMFAVLLCVMFFISLSQAQYRGSIRGIITDPQGAVLQGATVTLLNTDTNAAMTAKSDENGIYVLNALPTANYRITVEQSGFKKKVLEKVQIIPDQLNALNLQLELGSVQETVVVTDTTRGKRSSGSVCRSAVPEQQLSARRNQHDQCRLGRNDDHHAYSRSGTGSESGLARL